MFSIPIQSSNEDYVKFKVNELKRSGFVCEKPIRENKPHATHSNDGKTIFFVRMIKLEEK